MGQDYYKLLGVERSADDTAIKAGYKKMALKWHPDRNGGSEEASQKFKEISEAFEVLSDSNKRAIYDQFGEEGLKSGGPVPGQGGGQGFSSFSGFPGAGGSSGAFPGGATFSFSSSGPSGFNASDPQKIFESMFGSGFTSFGGMGGMGGMGGGRAPRGGGGRRGRSMFDNQDVFMDDAFDSMPGGFASSSAPRSASPSKAPQPASEISRPLKLSLNELYSGTTKRLKVGRKLLDGTSEERVHEIHVQPGWKSGTKVRFPHAGNEMSSGDAQDLVFVVEEKQHETFERRGNDLVAKVPISLIDALTGTAGRKVVVEALDGRKLQIAVPPSVVKPFQETVVGGEGMPIRKDGSVRTKGNLVVLWDVQFPDRITPAQRDELKKALS
ncbi:DnaJ-domain-containing protein [Mycena kentingensis (nom. inval.)]|nr:DnaJ-domain-containing protein [Mycena kentingensis (nom. inval.)]